MLCLEHFTVTAIIFHCMKYHNFLTPNICNSVLCELHETTEDVPVLLIGMSLGLAQCLAKTRDPEFLWQKMDLKKIIGIGVNPFY